MSCVMKVLMLIFSDGIDNCNCNANTLLDLSVPSVPSVIPGVIHQFVHK